MSRVSLLRSSGPSTLEDATEFPPVLGRRSRHIRRSRDQARVLLTRLCPGASQTCSVLAALHQVVHSLGAFVILFFREPKYEENLILE